MPTSKILVAVLCTHERTGWICPSLSQWLTDLPFMAGDKEFSVTYARNFIPAASARNYICRKYKDATPRPDWILMIDNDMAPQQDLLNSVDDAPEDAAVIVPQFQMWDEAKPSVTLCWGMDEAIAPKANGRQKFVIESGKWYPLTKCGTGAIFIRPSIFDKIEMPYFWYPLNQDQGIEGTEDIAFSKKVLDAGYKIYGNSKVSPVGHYHNVNLAVVAKYMYGQPLSRPANGKALDKHENMEVENHESPSDSPVAAASPAR